MTPKEDIKPLYEKVLKDIMIDSETNRENDIKTIDSEMNKIRVRLESLQDKFADNQIEITEYNNIKQRYDSQLRVLVEKRKEIISLSNDIHEKLTFCFSLLNNLPSIFSEAPIDLKQQIIGSIFPDSLEFSENRYRTSRVNSVVEMICNISKPFGRNKKGQFIRKSELSHEVTLKGLEPPTFRTGI